MFPSRFRFLSFYRGQIGEKTVARRVENDHQRRQNRTTEKQSTRHFDAAVAAETTRRRRRQIYKSLILKEIFTQCTTTLTLSAKGAPFPVGTNAIERHFHVVEATLIGGVALMKRRRRVARHEDGLARRAGERRRARARESGRAARRTRSAVETRFDCARIRRTLAIVAGKIRRTFATRFVANEIDDDARAAVETRATATRIDRALAYTARTHGVVEIVRNSVDFQLRNELLIRKKIDYLSFLLRLCSL